MLDARMLAKIARVDPELLSPIQHGSEERQLHRLSITLRDSLVKQRVNIISTIRPPACDCRDAPSLFRQLVP